MKYWSETYDEKPVRTSEEKEVTKENIIQILEYIERGYLPDWNYETHQGVSLPNEYYPLHVAIRVAIKALDAQDDGFFKAQGQESVR